MKNSKLYFLIALVISSAYVLQRSLLIMSGNLNLEQVQQQSQVQTDVIGFDVSFSYMAMNIYWPFIISIFLFGYKVSSSKLEEVNFIEEFKKSKIMSVGIVTLLPLLTLFFHFFSISQFTFDQLSIVFGVLEDIQTHQGWIKAPMVANRVAALAIVLLTLISLVVSIYSLFVYKEVKVMPNKPIKQD
jgi:hypothetical protein